MSTGVFASLLVQSKASAALPAALVAGTVKAAMLVAAGQAATAGVVSAHVAALTRGVLHTMFVTKLTLASEVLLAVSIVGAPTGLWAYHSFGGEAPEPKRAAQPGPAAQAKDEPKKEAEKDSEAIDRERSVDNLKWIMLAMHGYQDVNRRFPPAAVYDNNGKALLSWRVLILPYLDQDALFKEFKLDQSWDSEHNKKLLAKMPKKYGPVRGKTKERFSTYYQVFTGKGTAFEGTQGVGIADITDGTVTTICIVEAAEAVPWTKPADLIYDPDKPLPKLGGQFKDVFHAAFCDGSVHTLKRKFDEQTMRLAITRNDGQVVNLKELQADK